MTDQRYTPPQAALETQPLDPLATEAPVESPKIGGWLFLIGLGLTLSPLLITHMLVTTFVPLFRNGVWANLTTPGTDAYHPLWGSLIVFELVGNLVLLLIVSIAVVRFFQKSRKAPKFVIAWLGFGTALALGDHLFGSFIPAVADSPDGASVKQLVQSLISASIWIPYFLVSKRVKATFVR